MDTYTINSGIIFCMAHFRQTFMVKGKYDDADSISVIRGETDSLTIVKSSIETNGNHSPPDETAEGLTNGHSPTAE